MKYLPLRSTWFSQPSTLDRTSRGEAANLIHGEVTKHLFGYVKSKHFAVSYICKRDSTYFPKGESNVGAETRNECRGRAILNRGLISFTLQ
uniref:Uncharacterized protein n=1 Tax=Picea glauca TaxID=3330 RepID=A0A101M3X9_PICGL|nr:hypothetical protein ABT39_MTgene470 [Picea glauca]QHR91233.1 hypothetical protein Q903MT_gene5265 [Picea sitchensis]